MRTHRSGLLGLAAVWMAWTLGMVPFFAQAADIVVSSATPSSAEQGTTGLLVTIKGNGFPKKPQLKFCLTATGTGTCDPDKIVVVGAVGKGATTIEATIDVGLDASTANFDVEVIEPLSGRKGRGTGLFTVIAKKNQTSQQLPLGAFDPDFVYLSSSAGEPTSIRVSRFDPSVWSEVSSDSASRGFCGWSPDGKWLLFHRRPLVGKIKGMQQYSWEIWVQRIDGSAPAQRIMQKETHPEYANDGMCFALMTWSPTLANGRQYIFYSSNRVDRIGQISAREISCSETGCTVGPALQLTNNICCSFDMFDFTPDGRKMTAGAFQSTSNGGNDAFNIDIFSIGINESGNPFLQNQQSLDRGYLGYSIQQPQFSARHPNKVLYIDRYAESTIHSTVYSATYNDVSNSVIGVSTEMQLPVPGSRNWDLNDAGDILFDVGNAYIIPWGKDSRLLLEDSSGSGSYFFRIRPGRSMALVPD